MLRIGEIAPDFILPNEHGQIVVLSAFRGVNPVVLIFYPADVTPGCTKQLCAIRDDYNAFNDLGAVVFGINPGSEQSHQTFSQRYNFQFHLLVDTGKTVARIYAAVLGFGPLSIINRTVYVIGLDGRICFAQRGMPHNETILAILKAITQPNHDQERSA